MQYWLCQTTVNSKVTLNQRMTESMLVRRYCTQDLLISTRLVVVCEFDFLSVVEDVEDVGVVVVPGEQLLSALDDEHVVPRAQLRLVRTGHHRHVLPQPRLRQLLREPRREAFGVRFDGEEDDRVLLFGVRAVLGEEVDELLQEARLVPRKLRLDGVVAPQPQRERAHPRAGEHGRDLAVLQVAVVQQRLPRPRPRAPQQKGRVLERTQPEEVDHRRLPGGQRETVPAPVGEGVQGDALLAQGGLREAEFVLLGLARDQVPHAREGLLGRHQRHLCARPLGEEEGQQCALRREAFVAEAEQLALPQHLPQLLAVRQQTRKVFAVILDYVIE
jgi:hypothetical protein